MLVHLIKCLIYLTNAHSSQTAAHPKSRKIHETFRFRSIFPSSLLCWKRWAMTTADDSCWRVRSCVLPWCVFSLYVCVCALLYVCITVYHRDKSLCMWKNWLTVRMKQKTQKKTKTWKDRRTFFFYYYLFYTNCKLRTTNWDCGCDYMIMITIVCAIVLYCIQISRNSKYTTYNESGVRVYKIFMDFIFLLNFFVVFSVQWLWP